MTKKIALVTGGLGGIGQEICAQLGKAGYVVVSTYMRAGRDEAWVKQLKDLGVEAKAYQCDVANFDDAGRAMARRDQHQFEFGV